MILYQIYWINLYGEWESNFSWFAEAESTTPDVTKGNMIKTTFPLSCQSARSIQDTATSEEEISAPKLVSLKKSHTLRVQISATLLNQTLYP